VDHAVLTRYRVMAYVTAVLLIILVFVGIPLQAAGHPGMAHIVGFLHGFLYLIYLFVAFDLTRKLHIPVGRTLLVLVAGTVPFGAIIAERRLTSVYARETRRAARPAAGFASGTASGTASGIGIGIGTGTGTGTAGTGTGTAGTGTAGTAPQEG
jgi:integral membrane protein